MPPRGGDPVERTRDRGRVLLAIAIVAIVAAVGAVAAGVGRGLNSDELAWQRLLDVWGHEGHGTTWISEDLFFTRFGLYGILDAAGIVGRRAAIGVSVVVNVPAAWAFLGALLACGELRRPLRTGTLAAFGLVAAWAPAAWYDVFFNPNSRTLELGASVLAVALLGRCATRDALRLGAACAIGVGSALIWVSDPFVLYLVGGAAALVALLDLLTSKRRSQGVLVLAVIGGSAILAALFRRAITVFDVYTRQVAQGRRNITTIGDIPRRTVAVAGDVLHLVGVSGDDFTTGAIDVRLVAVLRIGALALGIVGAVITVRRWGQASLLMRTLTLSLVITPVAVIMVNQFDDPEFVMARYLCVVPLALVGLAVFAVDHLRGRLGAVAAVVAALVVAGALVTSVHRIVDAPSGSPDGPALRLADAVDAAGIDRVYGFYFVALPPDQLREGGARWSAVDCAPSGRLRLERWNNDDAVLRSDANTIAVALDRLCAPLAALERFYGKPSEIVTIDGTRLAVWRDPPPRLRSLS